MTLHFTSGTNTAANASAYQVTGGEWASGTIQWSNKPAADISLQENISHNNVTGYVFSCLTAVQHWYDGDTTGQNENYGIMLRYYNESTADYNAVYSADYSDATKRPSLKITYWPANSTMDVDKGATLPLSLSGASGTITWTSSNTSVATVNSSGVVTGIQLGTATITAFVGGMEYKTFTVRVTIADGVYRITNTAGLNLGTYGSIAENTKAKMLSYSDTGFNKICQLWKIVYLGNGYYSIRPMHKLDMGLHAAGSMGSSVDIVSMGTNDTLSGVPSLCRWGISPTSDGTSYFINHVGTSSLGMTMDGQIPANGMGVVTNISSNTQGYFKWMLQPVDETLGGAILYDTNTQTVATNLVRDLEVGEVKTLAGLSLAVNAYSNTSIAQEFYWQSNNAQAVRVDSSSGTVTAVSTGIAVISGRVYRAGQYHYVTFTVNVGYPELFGELVSMGCMDATECDQTGDGFYMSMTPLSDILNEKGIYSIPKNEERTSDRIVVDFYDDWYIYAVCIDASISYGLVKLREIEHDEAYADKDEPGVTVSFISFDKTILIDCLISSTEDNRYGLFVALEQVTGPEVVHHDIILAGYFAVTTSKGAYMIADKFVYKIASTAVNNQIAVPEKCQYLFRQVDAIDADIESGNLSPGELGQALALRQAYSRIPDAIDQISANAGHSILNKESWTLSIEDLGELSIYEKQAILSCYSANVTFNSFAAEVQFHADFTLLNTVGVPGYSQAVRADMAVGEEAESGIADDPYYNLSSTLVLLQIAAHGEY